MPRQVGKCLYTVLLELLAAYDELTPEQKLEMKALISAKSKSLASNEVRLEQPVCVPLFNSVNQENRSVE